MKSIFSPIQLFFFIFFLSTLTTAEAQWTDLTSDRYAIDFADNGSGIGFMGSSSGVIMKTEDNGVTWKNVPNPLGANYQVYDIFVSHEGSKIVAVANRYISGNYVSYGGSVLYSNDGGATWKSVLSNGGTSLSGYFADDLRGWIWINYDNGSSSPKKSWFTSDGGLTWTETPLKNLRAVSFYDQQNGWAYSLDPTGYYGIISKTNDGGVTWTTFKTYSSPSLAMSTTSLCVLNAQEALLGDGDTAGQASGLYRTADGGNNWTQVSVNYPYRANIIDMYFADNKTGWIIVDQRVAQKTIDGGLTWSTQLTTKGDLNRIMFPNATDGFLVGNHGLLNSTHDGGTSWKKENYLPAENISDVYLKENDAWVLLDNSLLHSGDRFVNWDTVKNISLYKATHIDFAGDAGAVAAGGKFAYTSNAGTTWQNLQGVFAYYPGFSYEAMKIYVRDANVIWLTGVNGYVGKSSDGGKNFAVAGTVSGDLVFQTENIVWCLTGNSIRKTINGGTSWTTISENVGSMFFLNASIGWKTVFNSTATYDLYKTTDGAVTWTKIANLGFLSSHKLIFADEGLGWLNSSDIRKTINSGSTWTVEQTGVTYPITSLRFQVSGNKVTMLAGGTANELYGDGLYGVMKYDGTYTATPPITLTAPSNLMTTAITIDSVSFSWADNATDETGFYVQRADATGVFKTIDTLKANTTTYVDRHLLNATSATYRIAAFKFERMSPSNSLLVTYKTLLAPSKLTVHDSYQDSLTLTWTYNGTDQKAFVINRVSITNQLTFLAQVDASSRSYTDKILTPATQYRYTIYAIRDNIKSSYSGLAIGTTLTPLISPLNVKATAASKTEIDLQWTDTNATETGVILERMDASGQFVELQQLLPNTLSYADKNLTPGTSYSYRLKVIGAGNTHSDYSATVTATTLSDALVTPTGLKATAVSTTEIDLQWTDANTNETGVIVESMISSGQFAILQQLPPNTLSLVDKNLTPGTSYSYRIKVVGANNTESDYSTVVTAATLSEPPIVNLVVQTDFKATS